MAKSRILPARTSADPNASADVNELAVEALDYQGTEQLAQLTEESSPDNDDLFLMERDSDGALRKVKGSNLPGSGGGGGSTQPDLFFSAGNSIDYPTSNIAPLNTRVLTNGTVKEHLFDDTTNESIIGQYRIPSDLDPSGDVTFIFFGSPVTAAASKKVSFIFRQSIGSPSTDIDAAYTDHHNTVAYTCNSTQDALNIISFTIPVSTLSWGAGFMLRWEILRDPAGTYLSGDDLVGDFGLWYFIAIVPRA